MYKSYIIILLWLFASLGLMSASDAVYKMDWKDSGNENYGDKPVRAAPPADGASAGSIRGTSTRFSRRTGIAR